MAAPSVVQDTVWQGASGTTSVTVTVAGSTPTSGNVLVCALHATKATGNSAAPGSLAMSGWTEIGTEQTTYRTSHRTFYKIAGASEPTTATASCDTSNCYYAAYTWECSGDDGNAPQVTEASGESLTVDAPNHTPSGGSADYRWLWGVTWGRGTNDTGDSIDNSPSGYSTIEQDSGNRNGAAGAHRSNTAASENPASVGATVGAGSDIGWCARTISVAPAAGDTNVTTNTPPSMTTTTYNQSVALDVNVTTNTPPSLTTTTYNQTVALDVNITTNAPPALATTSYQTSVALDRNVTTNAPPGLATTTYQAGVELGVNITTNAPPALTTTTYPVTLTFDRDVQAGTASMTTTPQQASIALDRNISASFATLTTTTYPATVELGVTDTNVAAGVVAMTTTVYPASIALDRNIDAGAASLVASAHAASIALDRNVTTQVASMTTTTYAASIDLVVFYPNATSYVRRGKH